MTGPYNSQLYFRVYSLTYETETLAKDGEQLIQLIKYHVSLYSHQLSQNISCRNRLCGKHVKPLSINEFFFHTKERSFNRFSTIATILDVSLPFPKIAAQKKFSENFDRHLKKKGHV